MTAWYLRSRHSSSPSAAGILVTQSAADKSIGRQLSEQLSFQPLALFSAAAIIFCFGLIPGMPHIAFLAIALLMSAVGWLSLRYKKEEEVQEEAPRGEEVSPESLLPMDILEFEIGYGLIPLVDSAQGGSLLTRIKGMRRTIAGDLGVIVPPFMRATISISNPTNTAHAQGLGDRMFEAMADRLMLLNPENVQIDIPGIPVKEPAFGLPALWIKKSDSERAQLAGLTVVDASTVIATHLTEAIKNNANELLGRQELQSILDTVSRSHPKVVEDLIPSTLPAGVVLRVFKNLLKEKVPVKNVLTILETWLISAMTKTGYFDGVCQTGPARDLKPYIQDARSAYWLWTRDRQGDLAFRQHTEHGSYLALEPEKSQKILMTLNREVQNVGKQGLVPILLTSPVSRPYLKRLTERYLPDLVVLSHNEIPPDITIKNLGMVRVDAN